MRVIVSKRELAAAYGLALKAVRVQSPKPILRNLKMAAVAGRAVLIGTDLEIGIVVELRGAEIADPGEVLLPVKSFGLVLKNLPNGEVSMESGDGRMSVRTLPSKRGFGLSGMDFKTGIRLPPEDPADFPVVASFGEDSYHEVSAKLARKLIRRTVFATDTENTRYALGGVLGGVLVELTPEGITAVATNGRRLAKQEGPAKSVGGHQTGDTVTIIPARAMQLLERALADSEEAVQLAARENDVWVHSGRVTIFARLVEGRYPSWRNVFAKRDDTVKIELSVGPFHAAVRQAAIVTSEQHRGVEFSFGEGKVVLAGHGAELGESLVELPIAYDGPPLPIRLDPRFLIDFLRVLDPDRTFVMELKDAKNAAVMELKDAKNAVVCTTDDGYDYVLMPIRDQGHV